MCGIYVCLFCDTHIKLGSSKANHALICLSTVVYLKNYRWGCEALKPSIWYAWPHQSGVYVWVVFGSAHQGHCWAEVCDSAVAGWSSWNQLHYNSDKQMKNNKKWFILCFSTVKYACGKIWKDSAWSTECISAVCLGRAEQGCMIDYILPNTYLLCVIMYFQRISEHTVLQQMCTVEAEQNSNEVPSKSLNFLQRVFYHSGRKVEGRVHSL